MLLGWGRMHHVFHRQLLGVWTITVIGRLNIVGEVQVELIARIETQRRRFDLLSLV